MDRRWLGYSAFRELQTKHSSIVSQAKRVGNKGNREIRVAVEIGDLRVQRKQS